MTTHPHPTAPPLTQRLALWMLLLAAALAGCGGGGTRGAAVCQPGVATMAFPNGCPGDNLGTGSGNNNGGGTNGAVSLSLAVLDPTGAATTQVSPDRTGTLQATVRNSQGARVPNVAVSFSTNDASGAFVPSSGTALSDADGVARVGLPAGTRAGAFTVTASATVGGSAIKGTLDYAVTFPALTLGPLAITPATLSAGGNASVSVAVQSDGAAYTAPLAVSFTSPCLKAGKASMGPPVLTQLGVAHTSYTDRGCGVADVITASVTLGDATTVRTGTITVLPATAGSIQFVSAATTNIALKGTGGFGRQESSTLKFKVFDTTGAAVPGTLVDFVFADSGAASTVGGLALNPAFATSAADGSVTTLVTAGTLPTSVRVVATVRGSLPPLTTLSNILVVSTGVPDQRHFSLSTSVGNCEGRDFDLACSVVTATLGDHFGNPVPDGTAVNFTVEGGVIDASCVTGSLLDPPPDGLPAGATPVGQTTNAKVGPGSGSCSVLLRSGSPRQAGGRLTVLAYALGEEDFFDANGNNVFDAGDTFTDKRPDIFRNDDEGGVTPAAPDGTWTAGEPCIGPNSDGACSSAGDGRYNGVLRSPQQPSPQVLYVSSQYTQVFSGSDAVIGFDASRYTCPPAGLVDVQVTVADVAGNLMPATSRIDFSVQFASNFGSSVSPSSASVNNVALALAEPVVIPTYAVTVGCGGGDGQLTVKVTTPRGVETIRTVPIDRAP